MSEEIEDAPQDPRAVLLSLVSSLTLADHMGDASNDANIAIKRIGIDVSDVEWEDLGVWLWKNHGVKTLYGTSFEDHDPLDE